MHCQVCWIRIRVHVCVQNCRVIYVRRKIRRVCSWIDMRGRLGAILNVRHYLRAYLRGDIAVGLDRSVGCADDIVETIN